MNRKRIILLLAVGGIFSAGCFYLWQYANTPNVVRDIFASRESFDAFMAANDVTAQRVHYRGASKGNAGVLNDQGYEHETALPVAPAQYEEMKRLLATKSSYVWNSSKRCGPEYGMLVHFRSTNHTISVAFCFDCKELWVRDSTMIPAKSLNVEDDFDPINSQLVAIAKSIFPNDSEIQALK